LASRIVLVVVALLVGVLSTWTWMSRGAPDLRPWHTLVPMELDEDALDRADWTTYMQAERRIFEEVAADIGQRLDAEDRIPFNRYSSGSTVDPGQFAVNWNRTFVLEPVSDPTGVVVLLHGLTDGPYSMRHVAEVYRRRGFVALGLRLPAHGTVPGALTRVEWRDWLAALRLAMREAARRSGGTKAVHIVGYSNGGALAVKYALDALEDATLARPDRIVLLSPMIGVTQHARYAGVAGWPAVLPAFSKTAWLDNLPEFNPFKYNSFPVNAARQTYLLTNALQKQIVGLEKSGQLAQLPPILTFQSIVDATVRTDAVATALYAYLAANGSELVLFDINRTVDFSHLMRSGALLEPLQLLAAPPRTYRVAVVTNADGASRDVVAQVTEAGGRDTSIHHLGLSYPPEVFSLSHVALPFPVDDGLYGLTPNPQESFGIRLGSVGVRGERGVLLPGLDTATVRINSNPFFPYVIERIESGMAAR
jgi:alpha-beta hydrolase superfamily lysophospholipase